MILLMPPKKSIAITKKDRDRRPLVVAEGEGTHEWKWDASRQLGEIVKVIPKYSKIQVAYLPVCFVNGSSALHTCLVEIKLHASVECAVKVQCVPLDTLKKISSAPKNTLELTICERFQITT